MKIVSLVLRLIAAFIFVQTLYFKITGSPESVYIFEKVGMEPWGRYASGAVELIAAVLLLFGRTVWIGAIIGLGVISGAIFFHLTTLGIEVQGDGGLLFGMARDVVTQSFAAAAVHPPPSARYSCTSELS